MQICQLKLNFRKNSRDVVFPYQNDKASFFIHYRSCADGEHTVEASGEEGRRGSSRERSGRGGSVRRGSGQGGEKATGGARGILLSMFILHRKRCVK